MDKKAARLRRAMRSRAKMREVGAFRLCVFRSPRHMYAQVISPDGNQVVASASTLDKDFRQATEGYSGNASAAAAKRRASRGWARVRRPATRPETRSPL